MPGVKDLFERLIDGNVINQQFLGQRAAFSATAAEDVWPMLASKQTVLSFSLEGYERFHEALQAVNVPLPGEVSSRLPPVTSLAQQGGRVPKLAATSPAVRFGSRVIVPFRIFLHVSEWFNNKRGRQGLAARNAVERLMFSERIRPPEPGPPQKPRITRVPQPSDAQLLGRLGQYFDLEVVPPMGIISPAEIRRYAIDGTTLAELGSVVENRRRVKPLLHVIEDDESFHAVLVGPAFARWQEEAIARSSIGFKLETVPHRQLRQESYVSDLLLRGALFGDGLAYVTDRAGKPIASLVTVAVFLKLLGIQA